MSTARHPDDPGISPAAIVQMLAGMRALGLDVDAMCAQMGLSESELASRSAYLSVHEVVPAWRAAIQEFGRATVGLYVGAAMPTGTLLDYLAFSSTTLGEALERISRYYGLVGRHARWVLHPPSGDGRRFFENQINPAGGTPPPHIREFSVALVSCRLRIWFDRAPGEAWFTHAPRGPMEDYQDTLGCSARFERDQCGVFLDEAGLSTPSARSDPNLSRLLESHAERILAEAPAGSGVLGRVRSALVEHLKSGEPSITAIAHAVAMSERSLQRHLRAEGVSFRDALDDVRRSLAILYLEDPRWSVADVAYLLGYADAPTFIRAFKRWTGRTPRGTGRGTG